MSPGAVIPTVASRYLLPQERQVITVRQHPARLLPALTVAVGGLLAAEAVNGVAAGVKWARFVVWVLAGFLLVRAIVDCVAWSVQYIVITNRRLILTSGILGRKVTVLPLQALQNLGFTRSTGGQVLGYGAFTVEVDGQARAVIDYIPYPEQLYLEVYHLLYPDDGEEQDGYRGPGGPGWPGSGPGGPGSGPGGIGGDGPGEPGGPGGLGWPGDPGSPGGPGGSHLDIDDL